MNTLNKIIDGALERDVEEFYGVGKYYEPDKHIYNRRNNEKCKKLQNSDDM